MAGNSPELQTWLKAICKIKDPYYWPTTGEVARRVGCSRGTVTHWKRAGWVEAEYEIGVGYRVRPQSLVAFLKRRGEQTTETRKVVRFQRRASK